MPIITLYLTHNLLKIISLDIILTLISGVIFTLIYTQSRYNIPNPYHNYTQSKYYILNPDNYILNPDIIYSIPTLIDYISNSGHIYSDKFFDCEHSDC